ncbi:MAG: hypothetical protein ACE5JH_09220 [Acidobacteriota bacterium]
MLPHLAEPINPLDAPEEGRSARKRIIRGAVAMGRFDSTAVKGIAEAVGAASPRAMGEAAR